MDAFDYTILLPPAVAILLSIVAMVRNPVDRSAGAFLSMSVMLTLLLGVVWLACFFSYGLRRDPSRMDLWILLALIAIPTWFAARAIWKTLR
jgi:hypothetical protein